MKNTLKLVVATKNKGKFKEIVDLLSDTGIKLIPQDDVCPDLDPEETGMTFEENALIKARAVYERYHMASVADDSGLAVDALNGAPGVYSKRFAGEGATDDDRIAKLLGCLEGVEKEKRTARFVSAIACVFADGREMVVRGECEGLIDFEPKGDQGFGYDPVFLVPEYGKTFGELDMSVKNNISHRANALKKFKQEILNLLK